MKKFVIRVIVAAQKHFGDKRPICIDGLKEYCDRKDFEGAVEMAIIQTLYWNGDLDLDW